MFLRVTIFMFTCQWYRTPLAERLQVLRMPPGLYREDQIYYFSRSCSTFHNLLDTTQLVTATFQNHAEKILCDSSIQSEYDIILGRYWLAFHSESMAADPADSVVSDDLLSPDASLTS